MSENPDPLGSYLTPFHETVPCHLVPLPGETPTGPGHPLLAHQVVRDQARRRDLLLLSVDPDTHRRPQDRARAYTALDNEIAAGVRVARGTNGSHPPELHRLVGYHDHPERPFALLEPPRGVPLSALSSQRHLFEEERRQFRDGLLRALAVLHACGVVHRGITPGTVRWDEREGTVQVCGFTAATAAGTPRTAVGTAPWASPEQREGTDRCDPRDDLWSAGLVLFQALTGHDTAGRGVLPLQDHPDLEPLLRPMLARTARERPEAAALLTRFAGEEPPLTAGTDADLAPGRARFLRDRARKRQALGLAPAEEPAERTEEGAGPATAPAAQQAAEPAPRDRGHDRADHRDRRRDRNAPAGRGYWARIVLLLAALAAAAVALFLYLG